MEITSHPCGALWVVRLCDNNVRCGSFLCVMKNVQVTVVLFIFSMRKAAEAKKRLRKRSQRRKDRLPKKDDQLSALEKVSQWDDKVVIRAENPAFNVQVSHPVCLTIHHQSPLHSCTLWS